MDLISELRTRKSFLDKKIIEKGILSERILNLENQKQYLITRNIAATKARKIITLAAQNTQQNLKDYISNIVNLALKSVFENPPVFSIEFTERRNKTECDLLLNNEAQTTEVFAGGELDIVAFALRMAFISIKGTHKVLLLDETFKNLSIGYHDACANMIQTLSRKLNMQIILVSHIQGIIASADKTFKLKRKKHGIEKD